MSVARVIHCYAIFALALAGLLIALMAHYGVPLWAAALIALGLGPTLQASMLGSQFLTGALIDRRPPPRLTPFQALRLWLAETWMWWRMFSWHIPFRCHFPKPKLTHAPQRPAVLLIHGYLNNCAVWKPLINSGALSHCNVATVNLEPAFSSIDDYAECIHRALTQLQQASGASQVNLVCHSMGGLAARAYLREYGIESIQRIITLATPHQGTLFARFGIGKNTQQMQPGSAYLRQLALDTAAHAKRLICIGSIDDNLIVPRASVWLAGATCIQLERQGHLSMLASQQLHNLIGELLSSPK